jgi:hypothetical protein
MGRCGGAFRRAETGSHGWKKDTGNFAQKCGKPEGGRMEKRAALGENVHVKTNDNAFEF